MPRVFAFSFCLRLDHHGGRLRALDELAAKKLKPPLLTAISCGMNGELTPAKSIVAAGIQS